MNAMRNADAILARKMIGEARTTAKFLGFLAAAYVFFILVIFGGLTFSYLTGFLVTSVALDWCDWQGCLLPSTLGAGLASWYVPPLAFDWAVWSVAGFAAISVWVSFFGLAWRKAWKIVEKGLSGE